MISNRGERLSTKWIVGAAVWLLLAGALWAQTYSGSLPKGARCEIALDALHPTQFCVGEEEVHQRALKIGEMKPKKLIKYLEEHVLPVVIGPKGVPYVVDHHHLARAMAEAKVLSSLPAEIMENWSTQDEASFWAQMKVHGWVYPYRRGEGPLPVESIPEHISGMTDDPYRSLVWSARKTDDSIVRDESAYADFKWADFFRSRIVIGSGADGYQKAALEAARLMKENSGPDGNVKGG